MRRRIVLVLVLVVAGVLAVLLTRPPLDPVDDVGLAGSDGPTPVPRPSDPGGSPRDPEAASRRAPDRADAERTGGAAPSARPTELAGDAPEVSVWPVTPDGLRGAVAEAMPRLQDCYDDALAEVPDLEGRLVAELRIEEVEGIGQVTAVGLDGDLHDAPLEDCLLDALESLQLDSPEGALLVRYPFQFSVEEAPVGP